MRCGVRQVCFWSVGIRTITKQKLEYANTLHSMQWIIVRLHEGDTNYEKLLDTFEETVIFCQSIESVQVLPRVRWVLFKSIKRLFNAGIVFMLCHARPLNRIEHIHVDFVVYLLILLGNLKCHKEDQALIVCNCGRKHVRTYFPCWLLSYKNTLLIFGGSSWKELTVTL